MADRATARVARDVHVSGRVQGVGFRWSASTKAEELGLCGWVRNLPDGRVQLRLEGERAAVEAMLAWLRDGGPSLARVDGVDARERAPEGHDAFETRPTPR